MELSEKARIAAKDALFQRILKKIGAPSNIDVLPFAASSSSVRYRPRMRLHQSRDRDERGEIGYLPSSHFSGTFMQGVVPVNSCSIVVKPLAQRLKVLRELLAQLPFRFDGFYLLASEEKQDLVAGHLVLSKGWTANRVLPFMEKIVKGGRLCGISFGSAEGSVEKVVGSVHIPGLVASGFPDGPFWAEPSGFVQGNIFQNKRLIDLVLKFSEIKPGDLVLEGFAGAGNFTIPLAQAGARIEAFESHPGSLRLLKKNLLTAKIHDQVTITAGDAEKEMGKGTSPCDVLLVDPPRTGMKNIGAVVKKRHPKKIVFVGCDLDSLVRDSRKILELDYSLKKAVGVDLYPRTSHVEGILLFQKGKN